MRVQITNSNTRKFLSRSKKIHISRKWKDKFYKCKEKDAYCLEIQGKGKRLKENLNNALFGLA